MKKIGFILLLAGMTSLRLAAQPVLIGEYVEAAGLICFPVYGDTLTFKYLPSRGRLATGGRAPFEPPVRDRRLR